jgi:multiple sugar transport system substrate-binding protein
MKKSLCIILIAATLLALAACGQTNPPAAVGTDAASTAPAAPATASDQAPAGEPVEVVFWDMQVGNDKYPDFAAKYAANITKDYPNITIKYQSIPWVNSMPTFTAAIAAGDGPDFSNGGGFQSFQFYAMNELLDLAPVIDNWRENGVLEQYDPALIKYFQVDNVQVGVPTGLQPRMFIYRKDWFDAAGIPAPKTWDDLYNAAKHFTDPSKGVFGLVYPCAAVDGNVLFYSWFASNGTGIWKKDGSTVDWATPANIEVVDFIRKLNKEGLVPGGMSSYTNADIVRLASQDKVAMAIIPSGASGGQIANATGGYGKWALLPTPAGPSANGNNGNISAMNAYMAYKQTKHPEETLQALQWWADNFLPLLSNKDIGIGDVPPRMDWQADSNYLDNMADPFMRELLKGGYLKQNHLLIYPAGNISNWLVMNAINGESWGTKLSQAILTSDTPARELLMERQRESEKLFEDFAK